MIAALIPAPLPRVRPPQPPLPQPSLPRTEPDQVEPHLDVGRLDPSGRISARPLLHLLGWPPGRRVTFDSTRCVITATSDLAGRHTIGATGLLLTGRRYDELWRRVGNHLPWAGTNIIRLAQHRPDPRRRPRSRLQQTLPRHDR
jgi:hypothetical protein